MAWLGFDGWRRISARFAMNGLELAPPRVAGEIFVDAALPPAAENPPSLLKMQIYQGLEQSPLLRIKKVNLLMKKH